MYATCWSSIRKSGRMVPMRRPPIDFVINVPRGLELEADSEQLFRVIHNLCRNAIQALNADATDDPAIIHRVTVSAWVEHHVAAIEVDDTGPGMPEKARENLFTAFHGAARAGGTGLGLAIAHELIRAHGGSIELIDKQGPGTRFRITLPDQPDQVECPSPVERAPLKQFGE